MQFLNMTVARRLWILVAIALVSLVLVGINGLILSRDLSTKLADVNDNTLPSLKILGEARNAFSTQETELMLHFSYINEDAIANANKRIEAARKSLQSAMKSYEALVKNDTDRQMLQQDAKALDTYDKVYDESWGQSKENSKGVAREIITEKGASLSKAFTEALNKHIEYNTQLALEGKQSAEKASKRGEIISEGLIAASVIFVAVLGFTLIRKIAGDLSKMRDTIRKIESELDFTQRVEAKAQDELGSTGRAFNRLVDKMQDSLHSIASAAEKVQHAATSLNESAGNVAGAAGSQSESASTMAASVEQLTVSISHVGDRAEEANHLAGEAGMLAQSGERVIHQTVQDIKDIAQAVESSADRIRQFEKQSQSITSVVQVIKDVADQTNLLALNAAIEAARAGEQGRGFAVVADEVRKLAERTTQATQEIARTVEAMRSSSNLAVESMQGAVEKVGIGVSRAEDANQAIQKIEIGSQRSVAMVNEITGAIREQSQASAQIAQMVERIAQMAEESTAEAQNSAHSANSLDKLACEMQKTVSAYRLK